MFLRNICMLTLWSVVCASALAQAPCNGVFTGKVVDDDDKPLAGVALLIATTGQGTLTDESGRFLFDNLCPGETSVRVQLLGYRELTLIIRVVDRVNREIHLTEEASELDEVVIQHHDAAHTELATNFATIDERKLSESAGKSLGEVMRDLPGVNAIQTGPGIFKPVIHGVHSQRVLILNHGIRQEGQQWGAEHAPEIDPFAASNIVVVKDASAIKYGADAIGGMIIVNPDELPVSEGVGGSLQTVLQSNGRSGTISGMVEGGVPRHPGWGWRAHGTAKRTGDFRSPDYMLTNTGMSEYNFSAAAGYHKTGAGFDVYFSRFTSELGILKGAGIGNLDDLVNAMERSEPLYTRGFSYSLSEPRQQVAHNLLKINGHLLTGYGEWRMQYGFQVNKRKEFDMRIGGLSKTPALDLRLSTHTLDVEWESPHDDHDVVFTFGTNLMAQDNFNVPGTKRIPFIPNFVSLNGGVFGVVKVEIGALLFDAGVRYDYRYYDVKGYDFKNTYYATTMNFNNVSGTLGATYTLSEREKLKLNASTAWRPPHVAELFSLGTHQSAAAIEYGLLLNDSTNAVMDLDGARFSTETALKVVLGYQADLPKWSFLVEPYLNYIFNYTYLRPAGITQNVRGAFPNFRYVQTDASFLGTDLSAVYNVNHHLRVTGTASLLRARDVANNDYLVFIPPNRFDLTVRYDKPLHGVAKSFYAESKIRYVAKQGRAPRVVTVREIKESIETGTDPFNGTPSNFDFMEAPNGYALWNVAFGLSLHQQHVQYDIRLASENITNHRYREYTNRFRYYADDLGRNIMLSLKVIF